MTYTTWRTLCKFIFKTPANRRTPLFLEFFNNWQREVNNEVIISILDGSVLKGTKEEVDNGNNVDVSNQIPIYVGGWKVADSSEYIRDGIGYLIDIDKRIAYAEVFYENGKMIKEMGLYDGWYHKNRSSTIGIDEYPKPVSLSPMDVMISNSSESLSLNSVVINLVISSNCCNDVIYLNLNRYERLQSIEIGNECFENVDTFRIDGLNHLKSIKIGKSSFTKKKNSFENNPSRSFHVLNCAKLESIEIGEYSFSDYSGEFELKNLPSLSSIKIGEIESESCNFYYSSFVVKDLPNLQSIKLGNEAFEDSLSTMISNLPNLKSIQLGYCALYGREYDSSCSLEMKDLPKLEEIISDQWILCYPRSVILSNIPNLKTVNLSKRSFENVVYSTIESNVECSTLFKDVHQLLASMIPTNVHYDYIQSIDSTITSIHLPNWTCNDLGYTIFDFSRFSRLEFLVIGDNSFYSVDTFRVNGLNHLKSIKIGINSFTKAESVNRGNWSRSFHILNCAKLESIEIGKNSFSDYSGEFELRNLPSLSSIKIGIIGSYSENFCYSSFVVKDLPNLQSIQLGDAAFDHSLSTVISNLPNLKSIQLGRGALAGSEYDYSCSLEMKDLPKLEIIISERGYHDYRCSFCFPLSVTLSNIPNLKTVKLYNPHQDNLHSFRLSRPFYRDAYPFQHVRTKTISSDVSSLLIDVIEKKSDEDIGMIDYSMTRYY